MQAMSSFDLVFSNITVRIETYEKGIENFSILNEMKNFIWIKIQKVMIDVNLIWGF